MTKKMEVYKCELCGNIVELLYAGGGDLACCGEAMVLLEEKQADSTTEKHVPFIEKTANGYKVKVGENTAHPMTEEHYIMWIELVTENNVYREYLKPGSAPEADFCIEEKAIYAREYCNLHGHWKG